jgi:DNA-binding transcriptional regulator YhcF (GntR family)
MADRPTKLIVDCSTGERTLVELTDEEIAERELMAQEAEARRQAEQAEAQAKAEATASAISKLTALGLTEDEALALVGQ